MHLLKKDATATVLVGPVLDADGAAVTTAAIGDFNATKNGSTAALASAATATHSHNGNYLIALTTGNTDTLGRFVISVNNAAMAMAAVHYEVLAPTTFDALVTNAAGAAGGIPLNDATGNLLTYLRGLSPNGVDTAIGTEGATGRLAANLLTFLNAATQSLTGASINQTGDAYAQLNLAAQWQKHAKIANNVSGGVYYFGKDGNDLSDGLTWETRWGSEDWSLCSPADGGIIDATRLPPGSLLIIGDGHYQPEGNVVFPPGITVRGQSLNAWIDTANYGRLYAGDGTIIENLRFVTFFATNNATCHFNNIYAVSGTPIIDSFYFDGTTNAKAYVKNSTFGSSWDAVFFEAGTGNLCVAEDSLILINCERNGGSDFSHGIGIDESDATSLIVLRNTTIRSSCSGTATFNVVHASGGTIILDNVMLDLGPHATGSLQIKQEGAGIIKANGGYDPSLTSGTISNYDGGPRLADIYSIKQRDINDPGGTVTIPQSVADGAKQPDNKPVVDSSGNTRAVDSSGNAVASADAVAAIPTNPYTGTPPTASAIADAVLDEAKGTHAGHLASIPTNPMLDDDEDLAAMESTVADNLDAKVSEVGGGSTNASEFTGAFPAEVLVNMPAATLAASQDCYWADITLNVDANNSKDEWSVQWYRNSTPADSGITLPTIQVTKRTDGTDLIAQKAMTEVGSNTGAYKYDATGTERHTAGEALRVIIAATIGGLSRTTTRWMFRDDA